MAKSSLQVMRETWRPRLAHDLRWMNWIVTPGVFIGIALQPEAGAHMVAGLLAFYGLLAALFGIRQWGKNSGVTDDVAAKDG